MSSSGCKHWLLVSTQIWSFTEVIRVAPFTASSRGCRAWGCCQGSRLFGESSHGREGVCSVGGLSCYLSVCLSVFSTFSPAPGTPRLFHFFTVSSVPVPGRSQFLVLCLCYSRCLKIVRLVWARSLPPNKVGVPVACRATVPLCVSTLDQDQRFTLILLLLIQFTVGIPDHEAVLLLLHN